MRFPKILHLLRRAMTMSATAGYHEEYLSTALVAGTNWLSSSHFPTAIICFVTIFTIYSVLLLHECPLQSIFRLYHSHEDVGCAGLT